jgi:hypothetical protein
MRNRQAYSILVGRQQTRRPLGRTNGTWENNIRIGPRKNRVRVYRPDSTGTEQGKMVGFYEHSD